MFTLEQIAATHAKVKSGADFPQYVKDMNTLGVSAYDFMVADGQAVYRGKNGEQIASPSKYAPQTVADFAAADQLKHILSIHQQGQTDFMTFCKQVAEIGVEKWTTDTERLQVTYYDKVGNKMLVEPIPG